MPAQVERLLCIAAISILYRCTADVRATSLHNAQFLADMGVAREMAGTFCSLDWASGLQESGG